MSKSNEVFQFKLLIIGESSVGKSSLMTRYVGEKFQPVNSPTIGVDFKLRTLIIDGHQCKLQIWDTAGQERFRVITTTYYRDASGVLLVYDVTNVETFSRLSRWMDEVNKTCPDNVAKVLVGNKDDKGSEEKVVSTEDAQRYAQQMNLTLFETSARDNRNINEAFHAVTYLALQQRLKDRQKTPALERRISMEPLRVKQSKKQSKGTCCN